MSPSPAARHCWSPEATIAKPARSNAFDTAASWVDHVLAVAALLEQPQHTGELPLGALDAVDDGRHLVGIELHRSSSSGWAGGGRRGRQHTPRGVLHIPVDTP